MFLVAVLGLLPFFLLVVSLFGSSLVGETRDVGLDC